MLTDLNLDNENFNDLVEDAKNVIASEYPEWTDFNYHDPGITLSELFAFFKEIMQYRMNHIGEAHQMKYLKLLGIQRKPLCPAKSRLRLACDKTCQLPAMTRFYASGICFESETSKYLLANDIKGLLYFSEEKDIFMDRNRMNFTRSLKIPIFGKTARAGDKFYLLFEENLPTDRTLTIFAEIADLCEIKRNPIGSKDLFEPLARISMEYYTSSGWCRSQTFEDQTYGFLQSGWLKFSLDKPMALVEISGQTGYFVRFCLDVASYDVPPMLAKVGMNYVDVVQTRHYALCKDLDCADREGRWTCFLEANEVTTQNLAVLVEKNGFYEIYENYTLQRHEHLLELIIEPDTDGTLPAKVRVLAWELFFDMDQILGEGDGLPYQEYELEQLTPLAQEFILMIEEPGGQGILCEWQQVEDFSCSKPADRHYILDTDQRKIIFGDCIHGMAPEGKILIVQYVASEGSEGNVKAQKISRMEEGYEFLEAVNEENAVGGRDLQTIEDCFLLARKSLQENIGLVTDLDYETAVSQVPGLRIENCRVLHPQGANVQETAEQILTIAVKPFSSEKNPKLSAVYMRNIMAALDARRMIGTKIRLVSPEYVKIHVFAECKGHNNYIYDKEEIVRALNRYFKPFSARFGGSISYSEVYELLDRLEVVEEMEALSIDVIGSSVRRTFGGDIILPQNGLISQEDIQYSINIG